MGFDKKHFDEIIDAFTVDTEHLREAAADFRHDMRLGLTGSPDSSLRMLPSYLGLPTGEERGDYVAKPLKVPGVYDFIGPEATGAQMFDFLAALVDEAVGGDHRTPYLLGHTFSFPSAQTNINDARLIIWTKEFAARGVEGAVVNDLLKEALVRQGLANVTPNSVINDTVAVLLAAAYVHGDTQIGAIYATGHNTCYFEPYAGAAERPMILNMESGGFQKLIPNRFDTALDAVSEKRGEQRLEKMVSGRYMGVLFDMALAELFGEAGRTYGFTSIELSRILEDQSETAHAAAAVVETIAGRTISPEDAQRVRELAGAIVVRSARLITATFVGTMWQIAGTAGIRRQHIAVDGSVYEKMPLVQENIMRAFAELLGGDAALVDTVFAGGGSGLGAALAAAMTARAGRG